MNEDDIYDREGSGPLSEQASRWWVILHSEDASPADNREFLDWVSRSPERISAWLKTEQLMRGLQSSEIRWPDTPPGELIGQARSAGADVVPLGLRARARSTRSLLRIASAAGIAAAVLATVVTGWLFLQGSHRYQTAIGEQRSVVLDDGSLITLNTASKIEVDLQKNFRRIRLLAGEALFQVAHDETRPFEVVVDGTTVRAVGTRFNIDRRFVRTTVTVIEGKVAVLPVPVSVSSRSSAAGSRDGSAKADNPGTPDASGVPIYLEPAERLVIEKSEVSAPESVPNLAVTTAWVQRRLMFERRPLSEVAEEFNRYNRRRIEIDSPELRRKEVTGVFEANDPESFIAFLSKIPGAAVREADDRVHVVTK